MSEQLKRDVIIINNHSMLVDKEVADEIHKLREAVRLCRGFLDQLPNTEPKHKDKSFI